MKIVLDGIHANLRFSAAHMIPEHESCGFIHGHSYIIDVTIDGERSGKFGFVVDFKEVKGIMRKLCKYLDHKLLIPLNNEFITDKTIDEENVKFKIENKKYSLPIDDCVLLDLPSTTAEELAEYLTNKLFNELKDNGVILNFVELCVNEGIGQGAVYTKFNNE